MEFVDLKLQYQCYKSEIQQSIDSVLASAAFINGPAVAELEKSLCDHSGAHDSIACSSGSDALLLGMMALGVKPGDEVLVPDFTFFATAEMVCLIGAKPVFVDIESQTLNMDPQKIERHIGKKTVGIMPVSLYGQCPDMDAIQSIADQHNLWVFEDAAQSYGATYKGKMSCTLSVLAGTSFFPAKPLGGYGDGGAVFTSSDELSALIRSYRNHGQAKRYEHNLVGINGRLDTLQAAVLSVKLRHFDDEVRLRQSVAAKYTRRLAALTQSGALSTPCVADHNSSVWAQYTVRVKNRDDIRSRMTESGIPTAVHYPVPLHRQPALVHLASGDENYPVSIKAAAEVLSLPMHPFLDDHQIDQVCTALESAVNV